MLEQRVGRLEADVSEIKGLLKDQGRTLGDMQLTLVKLDGKLSGMESKLEGRIIGLEGRIAGLDGRLAGTNDRISALPTTWTILGIVFTTWAVGSGILIFAMNFLKR